jgi:hypothetical protein
LFAFIKSRRISLAGNVMLKGEMIRKPEWKRPVGRPGDPWEYGSKTYLKEKGYEVLDSIHLAHDTDQSRTLMNAVMKLLVS